MWKIARIVREESTKKHRNKKAGESITPIRYNVVHMHVPVYIYTASVEVASIPGRLNTYFNRPWIEASVEVDL